MGTQTRLVEVIRIRAVLTADMWSYETFRLLRAPERKLESGVYLRDTR